MGSYEDIINLPHHISSTHAPMPVADRAAQFSPFKALTGYEDAIDETARLTDMRIDLDEGAAAALDKKLQIMAARIAAHPTVTITYFRPDEKKTGGAYMTVSGAVKKIDAFTRTVVLMDGERIGFSDMIEISGELFP